MLAFSFREHIVYHGGEGMVARMWGHCGHWDQRKHILSLHSKQRKRTGSGSMLSPSQWCTSSSKIPPPKASIIFPNSTTNWDWVVLIHDPMGNLSHLNHTSGPCDRQSAGSLAKHTNNPHTKIFKKKKVVYFKKKKKAHALQLLIAKLPIIFQSYSCCLEYLPRQCLLQFNYLTSLFQCRHTQPILYPIVY